MCIVIFIYCEHMQEMENTAMYLHILKDKIYTLQKLIYPLNELLLF